MKKFLTGWIALTFALSMAGCSSTVNDAASTHVPEVSSETATTAAASSEPEVTIEETAAIETDTTWFGENSITFTPGDISLPTYQCAINSDGSVNEAVNQAVTFSQNKATFSDPVIEASMPDVDGNITYTITYETTFSASIVMPKGQTNFTSHVNTPSYILIDAYTGTVLPMSGIDFASDCVIEANGEQYPIAISVKSESEVSGRTSEWIDNDTKCRQSMNVSMAHTMTVVVPQDHNGLILAIDGNGSTEYRKTNTEISEAHPFSGDISTTIFKNVSYSAA